MIMFLKDKSLCITECYMERPKMTELVIPEIRPEFHGYTHSFNRYFELNGQRYDRLELIQSHGILSPMEAKRRGIPFKQNISVKIGGVKDYEEIIFLFPIRDSKLIPTGPGNITLILDAQLPILTPEDMQVRYWNNWVELTRMYGGEVYGYRCIQPTFIKDIIGI